MVWGIPFSINIVGWLGVWTMAYRTNTARFFSLGLQIRPPQCGSDSISKENMFRHKPGIGLNCQFLGSSHEILIEEIATVTGIKPVEIINQVFKTMTLWSLSPSGLFFLKGYCPHLVQTSPVHQVPKLKMCPFWGWKTLPPRRHTISISASPIAAPARNLGSKQVDMNHKRFEGVGMFGFRNQKRCVETLENPYILALSLLTPNVWNYR